MTQMGYGIVFAVCAGFLIELFFQIVKYRDSLNTHSPRGVTAYGVPIGGENYMSVAQYLSGGDRRWVNYFLFRLLPPFIIFLLLCATLQKYTAVNAYWPYVFLAAIVSMIVKDPLLFIKSNVMSEKILHLTNIVLVIGLALIVGFASQKINISVLAPSISGVVDNFWSSLLAAMLVLLYLKVTNMRAVYDEDISADIAISNYVVRSYNEIKSRFSGVINETCQINNCSKQILYAILIYENMNRPAWFRRIENTIVRLPNLNLTVGIAQVRSSRPLSDAESIEKAARILANTTYTDSGVGDGFSSISQLENILEGYNSDKQYSASISMIITKLRFYAQDIFGERK